MLKVVADESAIRRYQRQFARSLKTAAVETIPVKLGHPGASEKAKVAKSAIGWLSCIPLIPISFGRVRITGTKNSPWRDKAVSEACFAFPMDWNNMATMIFMACSGMTTHCNRMANAPISTTVRSVLMKNRMMVGANKNPRVPRIVNPTTPVINEKRKAALSLSNRPAPQLNPETGWKPCPNPMSAEPRNCMVLVTMVMAARAESPKGAATLLSRIMEILAIP